VHCKAKLAVVNVPVFLLTLDRPGLFWPEIGPILWLIGSDLFCR